MEREMQLKFFRSPSTFRRWFEKHHATADELWVGFYKKASGKASITWPESVDQALCFGWIDGIRKRVDDLSYTIRFTPRRRGSIWSTVNIKRAGELIKEGLLEPPGLRAFETREANKSGIYAYEQRSEELVEPYASMFRRNKAAWKFFNHQPPGYRKLANWWIVSAKKEETRLRRLQKLIDDSAQERRLGELSGPKASK
jgi:uncharacterized protein YdeI (YjbR/CyaY-like superfamily)